MFPGGQSLDEAAISIREVGWRGHHTIKSAMVGGWGAMQEKGTEKTNSKKPIQKSHRTEVAVAWSGSQRQAFCCQTVPKGPATYLLHLGGRRERGMK